MRPDEFEIRPDPTTHHRVSCPYVSEKVKFPFFLALFNGSQVSIVALWATCLFCMWQVNGLLMTWLKLEIVLAYFNVLNNLVFA